jgi:hypothetical protein
MNALRCYLQEIEKTFSVGNATEHTYRPFLKSVIESLADGITATNEPRREACAPGEGSEMGRVWINKIQYFEGVPPEVWAFQVGGYQVCQKWLKDRKGRLLTYDDMTHYQRIVAVLAETIRLMAAVDETIAAHGGWPIG